MKQCLHATPTEAAEATRRLVQVGEGVAVRAPSPDRGTSRLVRVSLEVGLHHPASDPDEPKVGG